MILAADPQPERTHRLMAAIKADCPDAFVQRLGGRVYAVVPAPDREDSRDHATAVASTLARRLRAHAPVGLSSFYASHEDRERLSLGVKIHRLTGQSPPGSGGTKLA